MASAKKLNESYRNYLENGVLDNLFLDIREHIVNWFASQDDNRAEDIAHDALIKIWRSLPNYPGSDPVNPYQDRGNFQGYVVTVANNVYKDMNALHDNCEVMKLDPEALEDLANSGKFKKKRNDYQD
jgi:DNA-directed RNA polymerase specialized sigma24 family protein